MTRTSMPTYSYRRTDGTTFDIVQRITEPALTECPTTGQPVVRLITAGAGLVFKGTGFYQTDYVRRKDSGAEGAAEPAKTEKKTESAETPSTTPKPDAGTKSKAE